MRISDWCSDVCSSDLVDSLEMAEALLILQHSAFHEARSTRRCAPLSAFQSHAPLDDRRFRLSSPPANNCRRKNPPRHHGRRHSPRSEEHTSELQSLMRISYAVFCLKKKTN